MTAYPPDRTETIFTCDCGGASNRWSGLTSGGGGLAAGLLSLVLAMMPMDSGAAFAAPLKLVTETARPFSFVEGEEITGSATEIIRTVATRAKVDISIDLLPWERAYHQALDDPESCVYSTTLTDERRPLFKWVSPIVFNDWIIFGRADSNIVLKDLDDLRPYGIGVYHGDARESYFESLGGYHIVSVPDQISNLRQLEAGRIDVIAGGFALASYARVQGLPPVKPLLTFRHVELGLACNKGVPDGTIVALNQALAQFEAEGGAAAIRQRFLDR